MKKILISGYYGFDNFGDDAILHVLVSNIKKNIKNPEITVISNNPDKTEQNYDVNSIFKFNFSDIIRQMKNTDVFISGGGSLLQDVTSFKSLIYYLSLIFLAQLFKVKTYVYAQGIGPINSKIGLLLTKFILKKVDLITVRDSESQVFLEKLGINSTLTTDPVWGIEVEEPGQVHKNNKIQVGIQLREWYSLDYDALKSLTDAIISNFEEYQSEFILISLQDSRDLRIAKKFESIIHTINPDLSVKIENNLSISESISLIKELDYLLAMRFHACLIGIKFNIPTMAISYDPKVKSLAEEAGIPYIPTENLNAEELNHKIKDLINNKQIYREKLQNYSTNKTQISRQNVDFLIKILSNREQGTRK